MCAQGKYLPGYMQHTGRTAPRRLLPNGPRGTRPRRGETLNPATSCPVRRLIIEAVVNL